MVPFLSEQIYLDLKTKKTPEESVHLFEYPKADKNLIDKKLEEKMDKVREIVTLALSKRKEAEVKVRQPLSKLEIDNKEIAEDKELSELIKEELNVKEVVFGKSLKLDTKITEELKKEGSRREIIRAIQDMRKKGGLRKEDIIEINYQGDSEVCETLKGDTITIIVEETIAKDILKIKKPPYIKEGVVSLDGKELWIGINKK